MVVVRKDGDMQGENKVDERVDSKIEKEFPKAMIEISSGSSFKLEVNKEGELELDRIMVKEMPFNYGYIRKTLGKDGDPLDIVILSSKSLPHGVVTKFHTLGVLQMKDEEGQDDKIIAKLPDKIDKEFAHIKSLDDVSQYIKDKIKFFFETYKTLEPGKWVKVEKFADFDTAKDLIIKSLI